MKINLERKNNNFHFQLTNERGHKVDIGSKPEFGGNNQGASPM
jgi:putative redox protein